jgi:hypothetical protein
MPHATVKPSPHAPGSHQPARQTSETETSAVNANDAALTELATAQSGSQVEDNAPNAPAGSTFDLVVEAVAGSVIGDEGLPYTLQISAIDLTAVTPPLTPFTLSQAFTAANGWKLSGSGPDYECTQVFPVPVPGGAGGPLAGHVFQYTASLVNTGGQIVSIIQSDPFVLV